MCGIFVIYFSCLASNIPSNVQRILHAIESWWELELHFCHRIRKHHTIVFSTSFRVRAPPPKAQIVRQAHLLPI